MEGIGYGIREQESVSEGDFWVNVSETYLKVSRILLDHHRVSSSSNAFPCYVCDAAAFEICSSCNDVAGVEEIDCHDIYVVVAFWKATENMKLIFCGMVTCVAYRPIGGYLC